MMNKKTNSFIWCMKFDCLQKEINFLIAHLVLSTDD